MRFVLGVVLSLLVGVAQAECPCEHKGQGLRHLTSSEPINPKHAVCLKPIDDEMERAANIPPFKSWVGGEMSRSIADMMKTDYLLIYARSVFERLADLEGSIKQSQRIFEESKRELSALEERNITNIPDFVYEMIAYADHSVRISTALVSYGKCAKTSGLIS